MASSTIINVGGYESAQWRHIRGSMEVRETHQQRTHILNDDIFFHNYVKLWWEVEGKRNVMF